MKITAKKELFFKVSLKLIYEKGFKATTMRDIAEQLNFEVPNIYNYIKNKQALLEIFLFDISDEFRAKAKEIENSEAPPIQKLKAIIALHVRLTTERPYEIALLSNEWRNLKEPKLSQFIEDRKGYEQYVKNIIKEGMKTKDFRPMDLDIATHIFLSSVRWLYDKYIADAKKVKPAELEKHITDFVLKGITL